ncbi:MAG: hypothetical protein K6T85_02580 [Gorillibacterium sp.]|nr:hypothetical protein [Gorillibacterium sp.]
MDKKEMEEQMIRNYQKDEKLMILVFAQWCVNHDLDPAELYKRAYPTQGDNPALQLGIELTVPKEEAGEIEAETVLGILTMFGNEDLGFVVSEEIERLRL